MPIVRFLARLRLIGLLGLATFLAASGPAGAATTFSTLYDFQNHGDGGYPNAGLIFDASGALYGTTTVGGTDRVGSVFKLTPPATPGGAWTEIVLYSFTGGSGDGANPYGGLIFDASGALYGTTNAGGTAALGTVFKLTPPATSGGAWTESVLYSFKGGSDGANPYAGLIFDGSGALYGTTNAGGTPGFGTVFKLTPSGGAWTESVLYSFKGGSDGANPYYGALIFDTSGALYGTTNAGGSSACGGGCGTVFRLTSSGGAWTESVLYAFTGGTTDGINPQGGLTFDATGALYGTTNTGGPTYLDGSSCGQFSLGGTCGIVFKLSPSGGATWNESVLYFFGSSSNDGGNPSSGMIFDASGALYGTTTAGGTTPSGCGSFAEYPCGTVFKLIPPGPSKPGWTETVLYNFTNGSDSAAPHAGLISDASGALYGTAYGFNGGGYGTNTAGTVFELIQRPQLVYAKQADFNANGKGDILWRYIDGTGVIWLMNGAMVASVAELGMVSNEWQIVGTGDFNGDGYTCGATSTGLW
jgi:uncharacterized repeat protein (TIGR03803 family)